MKRVLKKIVQIKPFNHIALILIGSIVAYISWSLSIELTIFSSLLFFSYLFINKKSYLFFLILGYYLFASKALLIGTQNYYGSLSKAIIFWLMASIVTTLTWIVIWSPSPKKRLYLFPIMLTLLIVPPIGFISCVNPIISSAIIFPKQGFLGIALYLLFIYIVTIIIKRYKPIKQLIILILIMTTIVITTNYQDIKQKNNQILHPINSNLAYKNQAIDFMGDYKRQKKLLKVANNNRYNNLLFHENALGAFTQNSMMIWEKLKNNKTILAGAYIYKKRVGGYDNVLMEITNSSYKTIYKQRVPVPISMWKPWIEQGAKAYPFQNPIIKYKQSRVGVFICYEQLLTYTYLHTMFYNPNYIIGISNLWWVKDKSIEEIQIRSLRLWSLLFGVDSYYSINVYKK